MSIAEEFATQMMGIGDYDEKWNHADKIMFNLIVKSVKYGQFQSPHQEVRPSMGRVDIDQASKEALPELKHVINTVSQARKLWESGAQWMLEQKQKEIESLLQEIEALRSVIYSKED